jgi:2-dehydropantoate 2-reductase
MKIAVIGSGSVGCYYGARLARCGHDVRFLMRRDLDAVRRSGLTIRSCEGDFHIQAAAYGDSAEIGVVDLVVCALKTTALDEAQRLIRPCVGPGTRVLALMNGLGVEEHFAEWLEPAQVFGGLAFVCINRGEPGVVHHMDYGRVVIGHFRDDAKRTAELVGVFVEAGLDTRPAASLRQGRWEKLVWNIPYNSLCVTAGGVTTDLLMADAGMAAIVTRLMHETIAAANADGCSIERDSWTEKMLGNTTSMGPYKPSMLIDYENKAPLEVESILGEPVRRASVLGVPVPTMELQYRLTAFLDRLNRAK